MIPFGVSLKMLADQMDEIGVGQSVAGRVGGVDPDVERVRWPIA